MTVEEAYAYLKSTQRYGSKPGLGRVRELCSLLKDPQENLKIVHVAGTNGKGSTCAMLSSILTAAGYRTGLFLSPYLEDHRDSLLIDSEMTGPDEFAGVLSEVKEKADIMDDPPTEFEVLTAAAFLWFYKRKCNAVVLETGMGGRLDATNIITRPEVSVITPISLDHTAYLGETVEEIAREKCGIIKQWRITVSATRQQPAVSAVIREYARKMGNRFIEPDTEALITGASGLDGTEIRYKGLSMHVPLAGNHQVRNALTAIETAMALRAYCGFRIPDDAIISGMETARIEARQEILSKNPLVLLDGGHNTEGVKALVSTLDKYLPGRRIIAVMGMLKDKEYAACIAEMAKRSACFIAVEPESTRALPKEEAANTAEKYCARVFAFGGYKEALDKAMEEAAEDGAIVICGSLYLAGPMRGIAKKMVGIKPGL